MNLTGALCQRNVKNKWKSAGRKGSGGNRVRNRGGYAWETGKRRQ
ncbi:hypothetical protein HOLDEFILI_03175 [Holdemania filiformis DSM 12042]|uniref:Uncharacterized protein n=1 Tax=Holdemania filiformis DSM 12042 TaxID=545696 RepID=B9YBG8_9FIRM|nr:hypothetical protein HOLDEFILI_03175 [Holdemania filiformis DSM 12042]